MKQLFQGVDEEDRDVGPLQEEDLAHSIHRRVAIFLLDETDSIFMKKDRVPEEHVLYRESSEEAARNLLRRLHLSGDPVALGGVLHLRDQFSTLTHTFLVRVAGPMPEWERYSLPLEEAGGQYKDFIDRSLRPGAYRPLYIREDHRS